MSGARLRIASIAAVLLVLSLPTARAADPDERFFTALEDLPVMPGMREVVDAGIVFDKPQGRIVSVYAEGSVARSAVLDYYGKALPQLGWEIAGERRFRREGELLQLDIIDRAKTLTIRFSLSPN